jgi:hypothetical protein
MKDRRLLGRAISVLAAALTAAVVVVTVQPVGAHVTENFGHLWTQHIRDKGDARWEAKGTIRQFGQVGLAAVAPPDTRGITLVQAGPFTLEARCITIGGDPGVRGQVELSTSEAHSAYRSSGDYDEDFNPGEGANWAQSPSFVQAGRDLMSEPEQSGHAMAPSGWAMEGKTAIFLDFDGSDCVFAGYVKVTAIP